MSKPAEDEQPANPPASISGSIVAAGIDHASAIKGELDPVYEAKAMVLNRAVSAM